MWREILAVVLVFVGLGAFVALVSTLAMLAGAWGLW